MMVFHCLIDPKVPIPPHAKDPERTQSFVNMLKADRTKAWEPDYLRAPNATRYDSQEEPTVYRAPGYVSALSSPELLTMLKISGVKSLIIAGISTSGCVLHTAVVASAEDFVVTVVSDACADPGEGVHEMMVEKVLPMRAHVCTFEELKCNHTAMWSAGLQ